MQYKAQNRQFYTFTVMLSFNSVAFGPSALPLFHIRINTFFFSQYLLLSVVKAKS